MRDASRGDGAAQGRLNERRKGHHREGTEGTELETRGVDVTEQILGAAIAVHRALGPGLVESTDEACLAFELLERGLRIERQTALPVGLRLNFKVPRMREGIRRFVRDPSP